MHIYTVDVISLTHAHAHTHAHTNAHAHTEPLQHRLFAAMLSMKSVQLRASIQPMLWIGPRCVSGRRGQLDDIPAHSRRESE